MFGSESRRCQVGHALRVPFGSFRHHGKFGGNGGQVVGSHRCTLDPGRPDVRWCASSGKPEPWEQSASVA